MFDPNPWNALFVFRAFEMHADERATARRAPKRSWHVKRRLMRLYVRATRANPNELGVESKGHVRGHRRRGVNPRARHAPKLSDAGRRGK